MYLKDIINGTCLRSVNDGEGYNISETYLKKTGDSKENFVTFTSEDEGNPSSWADVPVLATREKHSSILNKISTMFKNVRWLYKMLGTTDISAIADGTLTGAVSMLNTGINEIASHFIQQPQTDNMITRFTHWDFCIYKVGRMVMVFVNFSGDMEPTPGTAYKLLAIPEVYRPIANIIATYPTQINGVTVMAAIQPDGSFMLFNDNVKITNDWICRQVFTYISKQ